MNRALFPLPVFLLPNGITRLRVFEARYIRLVQESAGDIGFIITPEGNLTDLDSLLATKSANMPDQRTLDPLVSWGSLVKIIDFEKGADGLLEIDVKCESMVLISSLRQEDDGLRKGHVATYEFWPSASLDADFINSEQMAKLTNNLTHIFNLNPELEELYAETHFDDPVWVCQRWLELLPLNQHEMNVFAQANSFKRSFQFLTSVVFK